MPFLFSTSKSCPTIFISRGISITSATDFIPEDFDEDLPESTKIDARSLNQLRSILFGGKNWDQFSLLVSGRCSIT